MKSFLALLFLFSTCLAQADEILVRPGKVIGQPNLRQPLGPDWSVARGKWIPGKMNRSLNTAPQTLSVGLAILMFTESFADSVPIGGFNTRTLPGSPMGKCETRWLAPFVLAMSYSVGGNAVTTIRWFNEAGDVTRELSGPSVDARSDYIVERKGGGSVIHGIDGLWQFDFPKIPLSDLSRGFMDGRGDTFIHQFQPAPGQTAVDFYESGNFVGSVGPFAEHRFGDAHLENDGCVTLMTGRTKDNNNSQVVLIGADRKIRFQVDCGEDVIAPFPLANGAGVLLKLNPQHDPPVRFKYVAPGIDPVTYGIGANASPVVGIPDGDLVLFRTDIGGEERFQLVHGTNGNLVWDIASPVRIWRQMGGTTATSAMVVDDQILLLGQDMAAVELKSGQIIARWKSNVLGRSSAHFVRLAGKLFAVSDSEFFQLDLADIPTRRNGWH